jgi:hypothetical protein
MNVQFLHELCNKIWALLAEVHRYVFTVQPTYVPKPKICFAESKVEYSRWTCYKYQVTKYNSMLWGSLESVTNPYKLPEYWGGGEEGDCSRVYFLSSPAIWANLPDNSWLEKVASKSGLRLVFQISFLKIRQLLVQPAPNSGVKLGEKHDKPPVIPCHPRSGRSVSAAFKIYWGASLQIRSSSRNS